MSPLPPPLDQTSRRSLPSRCHSRLQVSRHPTSPPPRSRRPAQRRQAHCRQRMDHDRLARAPTAPVAVRVAIGNRECPRSRHRWIKLPRAHSRPAVAPACRCPATQRHRRPAHAHRAQRRQAHCRQRIDRDRLARAPTAPVPVRVAIGNRECPRSRHRWIKLPSRSLPSRCSSRLPVSRHPASPPPRSRTPGSTPPGSPSATH